MVYGYDMGLSENVVYPIEPNGFADHYPYEKWLATIGNINPTFSDKPTSGNLDLAQVSKDIHVCSHRMVTQPLTQKNSSGPQPRRDVVIDQMGNKKHHDDSEPRRNFHWIPGLVN